MMPRDNKKGADVNYATLNSSVNQYRQVNNYSGVTDADPHRLVQMLLEGVLDKIAVVKGLVTRGQLARKGEVIGQAIAIIGGLRSSLDHAAGGELAVNLDDLYEYTERRLVEANLKNDVGMLDEVSALLKEIKSAWDSIPAELRSKNRRGLTVVSSH